MIQGAHEVELTGVEREVVQVACSQLRSREQTPSTANVREVVQSRLASPCAGLRPNKQPTRSVHV